MRNALASLCVFVAAAAAVAQDARPAERPDPLEPLMAAMKEQDALVDQDKADKAIADARERAKDGTPDGLYLLGRALGNKAVRRAEQQRIERMKARKPGSDEAPPDLVLDADSNRLLDEARENFERASEAGALVYAPAHLGIGRVARVKGDLDAAVDELKQAVRIAPNFKAAALELAQSYWDKKLWAEAEYALHSFLSHRPTDVDARMMLGWLLMHPERRRYAEAEPEFRAILSSDPANVNAHRLLASALQFQSKYKESAEEWEAVRAAEPKDDEPYMTLFTIYHKLNKKDEALAVLDGAVRQLPGTEVARRAKSLIEQLKEHPESWDAKEPGDADRDALEDLKRRLDSTDDPAVVQKTLEEMRAYKWPALPGAVYQWLLKDSSTPAIRLAAVRLIADVANPQTLTILEIMLLHPKEREPDAAVRKEVARAVSLLPTDAAVPILFAALTDADADVRESAVAGIAARTGKWFRADLGVRTADKDWPAELELYGKWWNSSSASAAKRGATTALAAIYEPVSHDSKMRIAQYALPAMDDPVEATWRAGYDLFRALTFHSFGADEGSVSGDDRKRITDEARTWLDEQLKKAK